MKPMLLILLFSGVEMLKTRKIDPFSEEDYWETVKGTKTFIKKEINDKGELNQPSDSQKWLRVVAISDTHDQLGNMTGIPDGDVLVHTGDFTNLGSFEQLTQFNEDLGKLPHKHKIIVAGNHDLGFDDTEDVTKRVEKYQNDGTPQGYKLITNAVWLHDRELVIEGVKFYGSSWHPLPGYPFYTTRGVNMAKRWKNIPNDTDVLLTHTPPLGYLDTFGDERWGCRDLLREIEERVKPQFHVFGHVHECYGAASNGHTVFVNAASCQKQNRLNNKPIVFYVKTK